MVKFEQKFFPSEAEKLKNIIKSSQLSDFAFRKSLIYLHRIKRKRLPCDEEPFAIFVAALIVASKHNAAPDDLAISWKDIIPFSEMKIFDLQLIFMNLLRYDLVVMDSETDQWNMYTSEDIPTDILSKKLSSVQIADCDQFKR